MELISGYEVPGIQSASFAHSRLVGGHIRGKIYLENARGRERNGKDKHIKLNWTGGLMAILMERLNTQVHRSFGSRTYGRQERAKKFWRSTLSPLGENTISPVLF